MAFTADDAIFAWSPLVSITQERGTDMDINAALARMRQLVTQAAALSEVATDDLSDSEIHELSELAGNVATVFEGIDGWLSKSGAWPDAWLG